MIKKAAYFCRQFGSSVADSETSRQLAEIPIVDDDSRGNTPRADGQALEHFGRAFLSPSPIAFRRQRATAKQPSNPPPTSHEKDSPARARTLSIQHSSQQKVSQEDTSYLPRLQRSQTSPSTISLKRQNDSASKIYSLRDSDRGSSSVVQTSSLRNGPRQTPRQAPRLHQHSQLACKGNGHYQQFIRRTILIVPPVVNRASHPNQPVASCHPSCKIVPLPNQCPGAG